MTLYFTESYAGKMLSGTSSSYGRCTELAKFCKERWSIVEGLIYNISICNRISTINNTFYLCLERGE